jgi:glycosyltransferase involved in cell wall biosynthesis
LKIGIDVRMIESSGIGSSVRQVLDHAPATKADIVLYGRPGWKNPYDYLFKPVPWPIYSIAQHWSYARFLNQERLSVFYMPHYDVPYFYAGSFVATIHDLNHLVLPQTATKPFASVYAKLVMGRTAARAREILVDSMSTRDDLVRYFPSVRPRVKIVSLGIEAGFKPVSRSAQEKILKSHGLEKGYLLYVGNLRGSKNTAALIAAYRQLRDRRSDTPPLILVGKNSLTGAYGRGEFPDSIRHLGMVPAADLPALYSGAAVFVFPSLYEGFGLPPLEAMACGTPVVASQVSSLPEVCGAAAEYVDPNSVSNISQGIGRVLFSGARQEELRAKGFENVKRYPVEAYARQVWETLFAAAGGK